MFPALALAAILHRPEVLVCAVAAEAGRQGLDPVVVCALVEVESGFNPRAKGKGGDYGLFQIHPRWHGTGYRRVGDNVAKGCAILRGELARSDGAIDKALGRYNAGSNRRLGAKYAKKVLSVAARARKALEAKVWQFECSLRLWQSDSWRGLWSVDYAPRKRRASKRE